MTDKQRLQLADEILSSDYATVSDEIENKIILKEKVSVSEKCLAEVVSRLYRLIHPISCPHHIDWEEENKQSYEKLGKIKKSDKK